MERKIYLIWQEAAHRSRFVVGELQEESNGGYVFRYLPRPDLDDALKSGFSCYPSFPDLNKEYRENVIESFSMRLPSRTRNDFKELLKYWDVQDSNLSDFDLLSITGGRLATDHFEFIDPHTEKRPIAFLTELAGFTHYVQGGEDLEQLKRLHEGDSVQLVRDPNNPKDKNAVKVLYQNKHIGYIKRVHADTISAELGKGKQITSVIKHVDANGIVNAVLFRIAIPA